MINGESLWGVGIIILGLILVFAALRVGRLRRIEREQLDRNTARLQTIEDEAERNRARPTFGLRPNVPYAVLVPIVVVAFAVAWMIWSMYGSNLSTQHGETTGSALSRQTDQPAPAPTAPANDAASDSARGKGPLNKTQ